jgi:hypothetical protein
MLFIVGSELGCLGTKKHLAETHCTFINHHHINLHLSNPNMSTRETHRTIATFTTPIAKTPRKVHVFFFLFFFFNFFSFDLCIMSWGFFSGFYFSKLNFIFYFYFLMWIWVSKFLFLEFRIRFTYLKVVIS